MPSSEKHVVFADSLEQRWAAAHPNQDFGALKKFIIVNRIRSERELLAQLESMMESKEKQINIMKFRLEMFEKKAHSDQVKFNGAWTLRQRIYNTLKPELARWKSLRKLLDEMDD